MRHCTVISMGSSALKSLHSKSMSKGRRVWPGSRASGSGLTGAEGQLLQSFQPGSWVDEVGVVVVAGVAVVEVVEAVEV